jgi:hypothetical protein
MKTIDATLNQWAESLAMEPRTLGRRLSRAEIVVKPRQRLTATEIFKALLGDKEAAQARESNARAEKLERENKEAEGLTVKVEDMQKVLRDILLPVRQRILALPSEAAHLCNPSDPQFARAALLEWVDRALPIIRESIK